MLNSQQQQWTANLNPEHQHDAQLVFEHLCVAFNMSPFFQHNNMSCQMLIVLVTLQI